MKGKKITYKEFGMALICFLCITFMIMIFAIEKQIGSESLTLLGVIDMEGESVSKGLQRYLFESEKDDSVYQDRGKCVLERAGYRMTGMDYMVKKIIAPVVPIFLFFLFIFLFTIIFHMIYVDKIQKELEEERRKTRELYNQLQIQKENENRFFREMDQYEGNLYHQMKTPLTGLKLCLEQIRMNNPMGKEWAYHHADIQIQKLSHLMRLLLRDKQLSSEKIRFHFDSVSLLEILGESIEHLTAQITMKNIKVKIETELEEAFIAGDRIWLEEAMVTIFDNVTEHSIEGSEILIELYKKKAEYQISFFSRGTWIDEDKLPHLCERYYSDSQSNSHFGIGLHLAHTVVKQHHGRLSIYNEKKHTIGRGVAFQINFPILIGSDLYNVTAL